MTTSMMSADDLRFFSPMPSTAPAMQGYVPDFNFQMPVAPPTAMSAADFNFGGTSFGNKFGSAAPSYAGTPWASLGAYATNAGGGQVPGGGGAGGWGGKVMNWLGNSDNLNATINGIGALTGAYLGFQNLRLAKDNLRFQKDAWAKNYANQAQSYNTSLEDRTRARYSARETDESKIQDYLNRNRLSKN